MAAPSPPSPLGKYGPEGRVERDDQREVQFGCLLPATERPTRHYRGAALLEVNVKGREAHPGSLADTGIGALPLCRSDLGLGGDLVSSHSFYKVKLRCVPGNPSVFNSLRSNNGRMVVFTCTTCM